mmetsp:Transcript_1279/g.5036  ORF Transcript_1279/g.5036 Transcript_1279/m.5036 type:complete len:287 (-) Transcript_1279:3104-3964(-)
MTRQDSLAGTPAASAWLGAGGGAMSRGRSPPAGSAPFQPQCPAGSSRSRTRVPQRRSHWPPLARWRAGAQAAAEAGASQRAATTSVSATAAMRVVATTREMATAAVTVGRSRQLARRCLGRHRTWATTRRPATRRPAAPSLQLLLLQRKRELSLKRGVPRTRRKLRLPRSARSRMRQLKRQGACWGPLQHRGAGSWAAAGSQPPPTLPGQSSRRLPRQRAAFGPGRHLPRGGSGSAPQVHCGQACCPAAPWALQAPPAGPQAMVPGALQRLRRLRPLLGRATSLWW